jgi:hypothetical protein
MVDRTAYAPCFSDVEAALGMLTKATAEYRAMDSRQKAVLSTLVGELRAAGCTWDVIGAAAGMTKQAARKRWHLAPFPVPAPEYLLTDGDPEDLEEWS